MSENIDIIAAIAVYQHELTRILRPLVRTLYDRAKELKSDIKWENQHDFSYLIKLVCEAGYITRKFKDTILNIRNTHSHQSMYNNKLEKHINDFERLIQLLKTNNLIPKFFTVPQLEVKSETRGQGNIEDKHLSNIASHTHNSENFSTSISLSTLTSNTSNIITSTTTTVNDNVAKFNTVTSHDDNSVPNLDDTILDGAFAELTLENVETLMKNGRYTEAIRDCSKELISAPTTVIPSLLLRRGQAYLKLKEFIIAQEDAEESLDILVPNNDLEKVKDGDNKDIIADTYLLLGQAYEGQGNINAALKIFERGKAVFPRYSELALHYRTANAKSIASNYNFNANNTVSLASQSSPLVDPVIKATCISDSKPLPLTKFLEQLQIIKKMNMDMIPIHELRDRGNIKEALCGYETAANRGSAEGMYNVSCLLNPTLPYGMNDPDKCYDFARKAAAEPIGWSCEKSDLFYPNLGVAEAENALGVMYRDGIGVDSNINEARKWFLKSATHGHDSAMNNIGLMLLQGNGGRMDLKAARTWFERAVALSNFGQAAYNLCLMLRKGQGGPQDVERAKEMARMAKEQGILEAMQQIIELDRETLSTNLVPVNSIMVLQQESKKGKEESICLLATLHIDGVDGCEKDLVKAERLLLDSADKNYIPAFYHLMNMYKIQGEQSKLYQQALKLANLGDSVGQFIVGKSLLFGTGVEKNTTDGIKWLKRARLQGNESADDLLKWFERYTSSSTGSSSSPNTEFPQKTIEKVNEETSLLLEKLKNVSSSLFKHVSPCSNTVVNQHWIMKQDEVYKMARTGNKTALKYVEAQHMVMQATNMAQEGNHEEAICLLVQAYELCDVKLSIDPVLHKSVDNLLSNDPNHGNAIFCKLKLPETNPSIETYVHVAKRGVESNPKHLALRETYGSLLCFRSTNTLQPNYALARTQFNKVLELDPSNKRNSDIYYLRGLAALFDNDLLAATRDLEVFLNTQPQSARKYPEACYYLALVEFGKWSKLDKTNSGFASESTNKEIFSKIEKLYEQGKAAEDDVIRLPIFDPVDIPPKKLLPIYIAAGKKSI